MAKAEGLAVSFASLSGALGIPLLAAPTALLHVIGVPPARARTAIARLIGARELMTASALLMDGRSGRWLAARVGGDALDLALVGAAMMARDTDRNRLAGVFAFLAGCTALDLVAARAAMQIEAQGSGRLAPDETTSADALAVAEPSTIVRSVTIALPPDAVYRFWRQLENLPTFMRHLESVRMLDERRSHWTARAPLGASVEWDAEIMEDIPGERIAWESVEGSDIWSAGSVEFRTAPAERGTEVVVRLRYAPPGGPAGAAVAKLLGEEPQMQIAGDLRRLKQILETGEVTISEAVAEGRKIMQRPAQPLAAAA